MKINLSFYGLLIISLYIGYIEYLLLFLLALLVHELGHIMFIKLLHFYLTKWQLRKQPSNKLKLAKIQKH